MPVDGLTASCIAEVQLEKVLGKNSPVNKELERLGFLKALKSAQNTQGFAQIPIIDGKSRPTATAKRKTQITYRLQNCGDTINGSLDCTTGVASEAYPYNTDEIEVAHYYKSQPIKIDRKIYTDYCNGVGNEPTMRLAEEAAALLRKQNEVLLGDFIADIDDYFDGTSAIPSGATEKTIKLFNTQAQPNAMGLFPLINEYSRKGYSDRPIVVGGTTLQAWNFSQAIYRGNVDGLDPSRANLANVFIDYRHDQIINDAQQHLLTWMPGHVQYLKWLEYAPESGLQMNRPSMFKGTTNINGEEFDLFIEDKDCDNDITMQLGVGFGLWCAPSDAFNKSCGAQETKLSFISDCGGMVCDDVKGNYQ